MTKKYQYRDIEKILLQIRKNELEKDFLRVQWFESLEAKNI